MKIVPIALGSIALMCLSGCGGAGGSVTPSAAPSFYSGTMTVVATSGISGGTTPIVANVTLGNSIQGYLASSQIIGSVSVTPSNAMLWQGGVFLRGTSSETYEPDGVRFAITFGGKTVATATLKKSTPPSLGSAASVPPAGNYSGEIVEMNKGAVVGYGTLAGSVDAAGNWNARALTTLPSDTGGVYSGSLATPGTIPLLSYTSYAGYVINQIPPAPYSFDGKTLIVRVDYLTDAGTGWFVMTRH